MCHGRGAPSGLLLCTVVMLYHATARSFSNPDFCPLGRLLAGLIGILRPHARARHGRIRLLNYFGRLITPFVRHTSPCPWYAPRPFHFHQGKPQEDGHFHSAFINEWNYSDYYYIEAVQHSPHIRANHDIAVTGRETPAITLTTTLVRRGVERSLHTMTQRRESVIRVNESDLSALKAARDQIDSSLALGAVARLGAQRLMSDEPNETKVSF